ncbi:MAG: InlB B-repeat-containing protein [Gammaproteobacteria bacterium]|nr:InlB B-repeat-containing protein [Gammaproteobacteria bacterium]
MKNKFCIKKIFILILSIVAVLVLASCNKKTGQTTTTKDGGGSGSTTNENGEIVATYYISFYTGDGATQIEKMTGIKAGDKITKPEDPKYPYHQFEGWYTDFGTFKNEFVFDTMPAKNLVLYAKWSETISDDTIAAYEQKLAETSEEGHLYIHYLRFNNNATEYEALNLWIWPYGFTGRVFDWNRDNSGNILVDDVAGATADIDLTQAYTDAGKDGHQSMKFLSHTGTSYASNDIKNESLYSNPKIGFLIVYEDSKDSGTHWRSDGNADQLFLIKDALWDNGSLHIFCVQDNVSSFVYHITEQKQVVNPYANDDGSHVSVGGVNSSEILTLEHGTQLFDTCTGVGYQIMVSSFADSNNDGMGDIRGIIENFDYLKSLHIDVLWLTPIQLSDSYHGYDIIDYKQVDPKFGTLDDYKELLTLAHQNGMKVVMDLVLNHTSTNNIWFQNSAKLVVEDGIDYRNFYQWRNHEVETNLSGDWYPYSEYAYSYYGKFSPSMPELNYDYQGTRDAIVDVAKYWLGILGNGSGVDGFRIDAVKHIYMADEVKSESTDIIINDYDESTKSDYSSNLTKNINFFTYFANEIKADYPNCYLVGENFDGHAYNVAPYYSAFDGMLDFYMYYNFGEIASYNSSAASKAGGATSSDGSLPKGPNTNKLRSGEWDYESMLGTEMAYSKYGLSGTSNNNNDVVDSMFTSNHDIPRLVNNMVRNYSGSSWSAGTVDSSNSAKAITYAKATISTMLMMPGITYIYYGDELGMSSNYGPGEDKNSPHIDRQYRQPFKWTTASKENGGSKYITNFSISGDTTLYVTWDTYNQALKGVNEQKTDNTSILSNTMYWTNVKSTDPVIRYGDYKYAPVKWNNSVDQNLFAFTRTYEGTTYWVITNFSQYDYNVSSLFSSSNKVMYVSIGASADHLPSGGTIVVKL